MYWCFRFFFSLMKYRYWYYFHCPFYSGQHLKYMLIDFIFFSVLISLFKRLRLAPLAASTIGRKIVVRASFDIAVSLALAKTHFSARETTIRENGKYLPRTADSGVSHCIWWFLFNTFVLRSAIAFPPDFPLSFPTEDALCDSLCHAVKCFVKISTYFLIDRAVRHRAFVCLYHSLFQTNIITAPSLTI